MPEGVQAGGAREAAEVAAFMEEARAVAGPEAAAAQRDAAAVLALTQTDGRPVVEVAPEDVAAIVDVSGPLMGGYGYLQKGSGGYI